MKNAAIIWTFAAVMAAACFARGLKMDDNSAPVIELLWYTLGAFLLAGAAVLWITLEDKILIQQKIVLGVCGAFFGMLALLTIGELIHPSRASAQSPSAKTDGINTGSSTGQQGGITAGTIIINPPPPPKPSRNDIIDHIALLMDEGNTIVHAFVDSNDPNIIKSQYSDWATRTGKYLSDSLGMSYAIQFRNAHGNAMMGYSAGMNVEGGGYMHEIIGKNQRLDEIISELRR
jgi:hypothetical protein